MVTALRVETAWPFGDFAATNGSDEGSKLRRINSSCFRSIHAARTTDGIAASAT